MNKEIHPINEIMTIVEAAERYKVNQDSLRNKFKPSITSMDKIQKWIDSGLIRRSGSTWLISKQFMDIYFLHKTL